MRTPGADGQDKKSAQGILLAAVAEDREPYATEVEWLFKTIGRCGGRLAATDRRAFFVEGISPGLASRLRELGVSIVVTSRPEPRIPHANKIAALAAEGEYETLVLLDCDTVVLGDFTDLVSREAVCARPGKVPFPRGVWPRIFASFGLSPETSWYLDAAKDPGTPYFSSAVVTIPGRHTTRLASLWLEYVRKVIAAAESIPVLKKQLFFTDQVALTLALAAGQIPTRILPLELAFAPWQKNLTKRDIVRPHVIHYRHRFGPSGLIRHNSRWPEINDMIAATNRFLMTSGSPRRSPREHARLGVWLDHLRRELKGIVRVMLTSRRSPP